MNRVSAFVCLFIFFFTLFSFSSAEGVNWKLYYRSGKVDSGVYCDVYYDKDNITYPREVDGWFGKKKDKSFMGLWTKMVCKKRGYVLKTYLTLSCNQRRVTLKELMANDHYIYPPQLNRTYYIEPRSTDELLFNELCK
jgi:hypothetical protein